MELLFAGEFLPKFLEAAGITAFAPSAMIEPRPGKRFIGTKDETQLFFEDWGSGQSPSLFCTVLDCTLNSGTTTCFPWANLRSIAYDRRGYGRSSNSGGWFDYDVLADDLAKVLTQLRLERVVLITHSMAAGEAVRSLTRHGSQRISSLVMVGATLPFFLKTPDNPDGVDMK